WAHNPKVGGSNPPPATNLKPFRLRCLRGFFIEPTLPPNWDDWVEHRMKPCLRDSQFLQQRMQYTFENVVSCDWRTVPCLKDTASVLDPDVLPQDVSKTGIDINLPDGVPRLW